MGTFGLKGSLFDKFILSYRAIPGIFFITILVLSIQLTIHINCAND